jgi:hypothetical protein
LYGAGAGAVPVLVRCRYWYGAGAEYGAGAGAVPVLVRCRYWYGAGAGTVPCTFKCT